MNVEPDRLFTSDTGLLSPEGVLYPCSWLDHDQLACDLGFTSSWDVRERGWQHLSEGDWTYYLRAPTQAQITAMFEWQQRYKHRELPTWYQEVVAA